MFSADLGAQVAAASTGTQFLAVTTNDFANVPGAFSVYSWSSSTGFGSRFANPSVTIAAGNTTQGVSFSPSSNAIAVTSTAFPYIYAYPWSIIGFGAKFSDPTTSAPGFPNNYSGVSFSPSGNAIAFTSGGSSDVKIGLRFGLHVYSWSTSGFGSKYSAPTTGRIDAGAQGCQFSPSEDAIAMSVDISPGIVVYQWNSSTGFGSKYADPSGGATVAGSAYDCAFSPSGNAIAVAHSGGNRISVYPWNSSTGFGTRFNAPATIPTGLAYSCTFSPSGDAIAVGHDTTPFVSVYPWSSSTGFGAKFSNPTTLPSQAGSGVAFSSSGDALAVTHSGGAPGISVYSWSGSGFGSKFANPSTSPSSSNGCVQSAFGVIP